MKEYYVVEMQFSNGFEIGMGVKVFKDMAEAESYSEVRFNALMSEVVHQMPHSVVDTKYGKMVDIDNMSGCGFSVEVYSEDEMLEYVMSQVDNSDEVTSLTRMDDDGTVIDIDCPVIRLNDELLFTDNHADVTEHDADGHTLVYKPNGIVKRDDVDNPGAFIYDVYCEMRVMDGVEVVDTLEYVESLESIGSVIFANIFTHI